MTIINCRDAQRYDFPALMRIWRKAFGDSQEAERFLDLFYTSCGSFVLEVERQVVAMSYLVYGAEYEHDGSYTPCPYLYAVAVDESMRGRGYGKEITNFAVHQAKTLGYNAVATCPETESLIEFYRGLGFTRKEKLGECFRPSSFMIQNISFMPTVMVCVI